MRIQHWTLRAKVVLHILVIGTLLAVTLTILYLSAQRNVILSLSREKAELVVSLMKDTIFLARKAVDVEATEARIHEMAAATRDIIHLRILTTDGRVFASLRSGERGTVLPADDLRLLRGMIARRSPDHVEVSATGDILRSLVLVENSPACYSCHDPAVKINGFLDVTFDYRDTATLLRHSRWKGILLALAALAILTVIILRLFERLINRPISRLQDLMKHVQNGDLDVRLEPRTDDEIGRLTRSFNLMVGKLKDANRQIEDLYNQRLEKAEHLAAFGELAAGLAHEVKNPLSGMKGALEIIGKTTPDTDPNKEIYQEVLFQIGKIINVIQDFLAYARPKPPQFNPAPPSLFIENAIRLARTQLGGKDITIHFQPIRDDIFVRIDADRMQEVVLNLFLNSIAAIEKAGNILVVEKVEPGKALVIIVADNGGGMKEAQMTQIFNPFFSTKKEGTGLGLSISKKIVDAHGGTIAVESRVGKGTTFTIRLPLDRRSD